MKIGIIGGGSIGLLLSGYLADAHQVTLYVKRKQQKERIESQKLHVLKASIPYKQASISVKLVSEVEKEDCYLICVKQSEINQLIPVIEKINRSIPIIFLQNGMGHLEKVNHISNSIYVGVIEHGASRLADNRVDHLGRGNIKIATYRGEHKELNYLVNQLHSEEFPFEVKKNWEMLLKEKLIINAVINPLTALFNVPNGSIIHNESIRNLAKRLCKEAASVLNLDEESSWERVTQTATNTGENTSSMRADILNNRKTEIEAISGYILNVDKRKLLPYTTFVYHSILAKEKEGENC